MTRPVPILAVLACALSGAAMAQNAPTGASSGTGSTNAPPAQQDEGQGNAAYDYRTLSGQFKPAVVRRVKWDLNKAGYYAGPMDSSWGPDARAALTKWQQAHGLKATGAIDTATLKALDVRVAPVPNGNGADKGAPLSGSEARGAVDPGVAEPPPTPGADGAYERVQEMQKKRQENGGDR